MRESAVECQQPCQECGDTSPLIHMEDDIESWYCLWNPKCGGCGRPWAGDPGNRGEPGAIAGGDLRRDLNQKT